MQNRNVQPVNKKWTWRKPKGKPKRPLSAYNIFFAEVRHDLLTARQNDDGIGFQNLAKIVGKKWKDLDPSLKIPYIEKAKLATERYRVELALWESTQADLKKRSVLVPDDEGAQVKDDMPSPIISHHSKKIVDVGGNATLSSVVASQCLPFAYVSKVETNEAPRYFDHSNITDSRINEGIHTHRYMADDFYVPLKRRAIPFAATADQSSVVCTTTSNAYITPTLHCRRLCSATNDVRVANVFHEEDIYEPLPFANSMAQQPSHDRFSRLTEEQNSFNGQNFDLFSHALTVNGDHYQPSFVINPNHNHTQFIHGNSRVSDNSYCVPQQNQIQNYIYNSGNNDETNNSNWNAMQLERLLQTLENEEWQRYIS